MEQTLRHLHPLPPATDRKGHCIRRTPVQASGGTAAETDVGHTRRRNSPHPQGHAGNRHHTRLRRLQSPQSRRADFLLILHEGRARKVLLGLRPLLHEERGRQVHRTVPQALPQRASCRLGHLQQLLETQERLLHHGINGGHTGPLRRPVAHPRAHCCRQTNCHRDG